MFTITNILQKNAYLPNPTSTVLNYPDTGEYHNGREQFDEREVVHTKVNAHGGGNHRLQVGVHANNGWTNVFLSHWDKEVGHKSGKHHGKQNIKNNV